MLRRCKTVVICKSQLEWFGSFCVVSNQTKNLRTATSVGITHRASIYTFGFVDKTDHPASYVSVV